MSLDSGQGAFAPAFLLLDGALPATGPSAPAALMRPAELSIIVPTYNESANLPELVERIAAALPGVAWEVIVVDDDSPDGTAAHARALHRRDPRVRALRRVGRRGLSTACIEGMLASCAPYLAVMDADLQHDPALLGEMLARLRRDEADVVVASRYVAGGGLGAWDAGRAGLSRLATRLTRRLTRVELADPMSGYFALRRWVLEESVRDLSGLGFKILLDILLTTPKRPRLVELPFTFGVRTRGESKLSTSVMWECGLLLLDKAVGDYVPARFLAFAAIGLLGLGVHFAILSWLYLGAVFSFLGAQAAATAVAIVVNYTVNNLLTYADRSLRGWRWFEGLASFALICGFGALANVGVSGFLFARHAQWPLAALAGVAAGAVWNYAVSARYTWRAS